MDCLNHPFWEEIPRKYLQSKAHCRSMHCPGRRPLDKTLAFEMRFDSHSRSCLQDDIRNCPNRKVLPKSHALASHSFGSIFPSQHHLAWNTIEMSKIIHFFRFCMLDVTIIHLQAGTCPKRPSFPSGGNRFSRTFLPSHCSRSCNGCIEFYCIDRNLDQNSCNQAHLSRIFLPLRCSRRRKKWRLHLLLPSGTACGMGL